MYTQQDLWLVLVMVGVAMAGPVAPAVAQDLPHARLFLPSDLGLLEGPDRHVTAEILHAEAQAASIRVSLATVYNTLHQFTAAGLLREIVVDSQRSYFDTNTSDHHHFFFEGSNRLDDIPGDQVVVASMPPPPAGAKVKRVDIVIRLEE